MHAGVLLFGPGGGANQLELVGSRSGRPGPLYFVGGRGVKPLWSVAVVWGLACLLSAVF